MRRNLDTDLLRTLLTVAEAKSFTKAGEQVFRTQAAISQQIKRLEDQIGKPLFIRGRRGIGLTREGELLVDYARRIMRLNDEFFAISALPHPDQIIRIGAPDDYATILLPDVLGTFRKAYPEAQVDVVCDNSNQLIREVASGNVDLALLTRSPGGEDGEVIRTEQLCWVVAIDNSPHQERPLPLAMFPNGCVCRDAALRVLRESGREWRIAFTSSTIAPILAAVAASLAVTVMEECTIPPGTRRLGEADGFPPLGTVDIVLCRAPGAISTAAAVLAEHIGLCLRDGRSAPFPPSAPLPDRRAFRRRAKIAPGPV